MRSLNASGAGPRLLALLALSVAMGCAPASRAGGGDAALADTLTSLIENAYDFEHPDVLARMSGLYARDDRVVSASGGGLTVSADSVRAGIARFWDAAGRNMRDARWTWGDVHVERLADDAAVLTGTWSIPHRTPDDQPHLIEGAWTAVFRRIAGEWKIIHEHLSVPPE